MFKPTLIGIFLLGAFKSECNQKKIVSQRFNYKINFFVESGIYLGTLLLRKD